MEDVKRVNKLSVSDYCTFLFEDTPCSCANREWLDDFRSEEHIDLCYASENVWIGFVLQNLRSF